GAVERLDRLGDDAARRPGRARAQQRVDGDRRALERVGGERLGLLAEAAQRLGGVAVDALGVARQQDADGPAGVAQRPADDEAVAAVVALAAYDGHRPVRAQGDDLPRDRLAGALHELHPGD